MSGLKKENIVEKVINFTPYGTDPEKDKMVKSDDWEDRLKMAEEGYGLNVLIIDKDYEVRRAVAEQGYGLNIFINDEVWFVRTAVARQGYGLDVLINDEVWEVRAAVFYYLKKNNLTLAKWYDQNNKEIDLRKLAFSPYPDVRIAAIESGYVYEENEIYIAPDCEFTPYGTDPKKDKMVRSDDWKDRFNLLINDGDWFIRRSIARKGYGSNIFINDKVRSVRKAVFYYLKKNNLTLAEWCDQNNKEIDLKKLAFSPYPEVRIATIESGYVYEENEIYIIPDCKFIPYGTDPKKDKIVKSNHWKDRLKMAEEGYGLNILVNDIKYKVRAAVARGGYGLNLLINDEDWKIRRVVADQGYGLPILINDKNWIIREAVAKQGYGLDVLINDENLYVQEAVKNYLTSHNLTLEQWKSNQEHSKTNIINQAKNAINDGKIDIKNVANNIRSTDNILNTNINKIDEINEISESNNINK